MLDMTEGIVDKQYIKDFLLAGRCTCSIENTKTRNKYLLEVNVNKSNDKMYFIQSITGMGKIYGGYILLHDDGSITYNQGAKGQIPESDKRIQALLYVLRHTDSLPSNVLVQHLGRCARCHRKLTDPESIRRGLGPECAKKI